MRPEATLEAYFIKKAEENNALQFKFLSGVTGVPDRLLIYNGITAFVELKAKNGILSKRQKFIINSMRSHGATVFIPYSKVDIDNIFVNIKK